MAVYIDDYGAPYSGMLMCHMIADTHEELLAMADAIGLERRWIQKEGTKYEHFDVCKSKRVRAIRNGAIPIDPKSLVKKMLEKERKRL